MKRAFLATILALTGLSMAIVAVPARAEEGGENPPLPAGIFRMADGAYFHALSRTKAPTLEALLAIVTPTSTPVVDEQAPSATFPLKAAILRARAELRAQIAAAAPAQPQVADEEADWRDVTLAIWNPATDAIRYVEARKRGTTLLPKDGAGVNVTVTRANGINSAYRVTGNDREIVVGVRYPIYWSIGSKKSPKYEIREVTYVPYSSGIHTPEMVAEGERWLAGSVGSVYGALRTEGIGSLAFENALLADAVDPELVTAILTIEHVSFEAIQKYPRESLEAFYVVLASNEGESYNYARSGAGAFGLAQFIPSTYASLASRPELRLQPHFETGLSDPGNAIRAEVAYLDYIHSRLPQTTVANYETDRDLVNEYLAGSYNGGYPIVSKAMRVWEENLDAKERQRVRLRSRLKTETMQYVLKLRKIREVLRERAKPLQAVTQ